MTLPSGDRVRLRYGDRVRTELLTVVYTNAPIAGVVSFSRLLQAAEAGTPLHVLAPYCTVRPVVGDAPAYALAVRDGAFIREPRDLYGKTVAVFSESDGITLLLKAVLAREYELNLQDIRFVSMTENRMPLFAKTGSVDAALLAASQRALLKTNWSSTLIDIPGAFAEAFGVIPPTGFLVVQEDVYRSRRDACEALLEALRSRSSSSGSDGAVLFPKLDNDVLKALETLVYVCWLEGLIREEHDVSQILGFDVPAGTPEE